MNIVIKNQNYPIIDTLNIEVIKTLTGEFSLGEIEQNLFNLFYNKVIIDITAIRNYYDINSVITFLKGFAPEKTIILLNNSEVINNNSFLSRLVENGYYNFTRNAAGINYLLDHPNSENDVKQYVINTNPVSFNVPNYNPVSSNTSSVLESSLKVNPDQIIIGIQNLTDHAGSTTLAYMMIKQLKLNYKVKGIEYNRQDFTYFRDPDLSFYTDIDELKLKLKEYQNTEIIIIDLNDFEPKGLCDEVLYLIDPGIIKINKLLKKDSNILSKVGNGKVVLNRSSIKEEEISSFEYETKFKVFFNVTNFNDRKERIQIIDKLLCKLGFTKQNMTETGIFGGLFGKK